MMATRDYREWMLPQMWEMVSADAGLTAIRHLGTWEHQTSALDEQRTRLRELRDELAVKWPPERSEAASAFIDRISNMIRAMDSAVSASTTIRNGLMLVVVAIEQARKELHVLRMQYDDPTAAWKAFTQRPMPLVGKGMPPLTPTAPGAMERALAWHRSRLDEQARSSMKAADIKVIEANQQIRTALPKYARINEAGGAITSGADTSGSPHAGGRSVAVVPAPEFDPPVPPAADSGPALAGGPRVPGSAGPVPGAGTGASGADPVGGNVGAGVSTVPAAGSWSVRTGSGQTVMRPGGVIGEPVAGRAGPTHPGGLIGGGMGGVAPSGRARTRDTAAQHPAMGRVLGEPREGSAHPMTGVGGWRDSRYDEYARGRRHPATTDPDNPWAVKEGVPPVLDAPDEPIHTAGPGVIGIDR
jgi:hypothetical protein